MPTAIETDQPTTQRPSELMSARRRARARSRLVGGAVLSVAIGAGAATLVAHGASTGATPARGVPLGTATVHKGDLIARQRYHGELSYAVRGTVHLDGTGTVTTLPRVGRLLSEGTAVASIDDRAIGVLFGTTPLYRTLGLSGTTGPQFAVQAAQANLLSNEAALKRAQHGGARLASAASVAQAQVSLQEAGDRLLGAERALAQAQTPQQGPDVALVAEAMSALGYYHGSTDVWSEALQDAVKEWQEHIGATPSGHVNPTDVLVVRGAARVSGVRGGLGDPSSDVTITLSSSSRLATFRIHDGVPATLARGRRVRLSAGGRTAVGRVTSVQTSRGSTTVQVTFDPSSGLARTRATRVTMSVTTADRRNVLTVPTQALLALASGGYALQLPAGRLLAVHTGIVQGDDIEVSGRGIHEGLRVVSVT